jgi:hypothetical protein
MTSHSLKRKKRIRECKEIRFTRVINVMPPKLSSAG